MTKDTLFDPCLVHQFIELIILEQLGLTFASETDNGVDKFSDASRHFSSSELATVFEDAFATG
jgi:hypothetical protein